MLTQNQVTENDSNNLGAQEEIAEKKLNENLAVSPIDELRETFEDFCEIFGIGGKNERN